MPPYNESDVLAHCLGFIAAPDPRNANKLLDLNICVGGGMATRPRTVMGVCTSTQAVAMAEAVAKV